LLFSETILALELIAITKPPSTKPLGRPITDENGNRSWEWHPNAKIDTAVVKALGDDLSIESRAEVPQDSNPYSQTASSSPGEKESKRRRTLDDMRRLSDEIKRSKHSARGK